ncbi:hypothetical protein JB92DRAFT_3111259 [Gautieria morchelliformis]|nr:hypothetical protein JB92DRAFT_3111259 [Gautieria morchelliformis]
MPASFANMLNPTFIHPDAYSSSSSSQDSFSASPAISAHTYMTKRTHIEVFPSSYERENMPPVTPSPRPWAIPPSIPHLTLPVAKVEAIVKQMGLDLGQRHQLMSFAKVIPLMTSSQLAGKQTRSPRPG